MTTMPTMEMPNQEVEQAAVTSSKSKKSGDVALIALVHEPEREDILCGTYSCVEMIDHGALPLLAASCAHLRHPPFPHHYRQRKALCQPPRQHFLPQSHRRECFQVPRGSNQTRPHASNQDHLRLSRKSEFTIPQIQH